MSYTIETALAGKTVKTGVICFADGTVIYGQGFGALTSTVGEICFNTAMTGYQEILSDPSYAQQIITFTFPHVGNIGTTPEDLESTTIYANGLIVREDITKPSNWRATNHLIRWAEHHNLVGISRIDTRALTALIRDKGMPHAVIAHNDKGEFDIPALVEQAKNWSGLLGQDLAKTVSCTKNYSFNEGRWNDKLGFSQQENALYKVVVIDYGIKKNILRCLIDTDCDVVIVPAESSYEEIMAHNPDGIFLSNGPGDPAATGIYAVPVIQKLLKTDLPIFGICLGHQLLGIALGGKTEKMKFGHHGANHPVKNTLTHHIEITSMNHGFTLSRDSLPIDVIQTHISLFDGSNCGIALQDRPVFSVQHHPEASPGPQDSFYLFEQFSEYMRLKKFNQTA
jgi:carbamoyl-phosphate synthase small subunit